jgi:hypothetical protein
MHCRRVFRTRDTSFSTAVRLVRSAAVISSNVLPSL